MDFGNQWIRCAIKITLKRFGTPGMPLGKSGPNGVLG